MRYLSFSLPDKNLSYRTCAEKAYDWFPPDPLESVAL